MTEFLTGLGFDLTTHMGIFYLSAAWTFFVVTTIWVIGIFQGNHSMMDGYYGFGYASQAWIAYYFSGAMSATATALLVITSLHGCRLGFYLSKRWVGYRKNGGGDQRYLGFVTRFAPGYWWKSFFVVMQPQTIVIVLIGLPSTIGLMAVSDPTNPAPLNVISLIGLAVFGIGYYFETVADGQLQAFKADAHNKGRYLNTGVWTYSRHPNYFGNTTVWWGIWLVAVAGNPSYWWTIAGPIMNTIMLTGILGRAFQDKFMGSRPEYKKLMDRTNSFLPIPTKK
jgi:steroid 5-alpha reductase family enzyme